MKRLNDLEVSLVAGAFHQRMDDDMTVYVPPNIFHIDVPPRSDVFVKTICISYDITTPIYDRYGYIVDWFTDSLTTCKPFNG